MFIKGIKNKFFPALGKRIRSMFMIPTKTSHKEQPHAKIYELDKKGQKIIRIGFRTNMVYLYYNSVLLYLEISNPIMGYTHSLFLSLGLGFGWVVLFSVGNILQKMVKRIEYFPENEEVKIYYCGFYKFPEPEIVKTKNLIQFQMSNLENLYYVRNRSKDYRKIYISFKHNSMKEDVKNEDLVRRAFISGTHSNYKTVSVVK